MKTLVPIIILFVFFQKLALSQPIIIGEEKSIYSNVLKENRRYYVSTPENYHTGKNEAYPVLYVLDGDEYFWLAASTVRYFANRGFMPQTIVVGIDNTNNRVRDLTPSKDQYSPKGGGANDFLTFLNEELILKIETDYRTQPNRTIYGASYGGLFVMYTLYNHPEIFDNYLAISPSLFHDNGLVFNQGLQFFNKSLPENKFVFLSLADEAWTEMRLNFNNTIKLFKRKANKMRWDYKYYDTETHESTKLVGLNDGLRTLHEFWFMPFYQRDRGIEGLKEHYKLLNELYRYPINIDENLVNRIAYNLLREKKLEQAKSCFEFNIENFPNSPNVYDSMGDFYATNNKWKEAKKYYRKAIELAKKLGVDSEAFKKNFVQAIEKENKERNIK